MKALVVTPTTGAPELVEAIRSVYSQTYKSVEHLIIVDGYDYSRRTDQTLNASGIITGNRIKRIDLPFNTGGGGFYGHRVMAGFSHLINHDYVLFLDQDNWYDADHVESLISKIEDNKFDWSYSLRKICDKNGQYITDDNCESLGQWPVWTDENSHLIDTSSYCFKRDFIRSVGHIWDHGWGADRRFYTIIKDHLKHTNYGCSGKHTLNYRLGGNEGSVQSEFFTEGNKRTRSKYLLAHNGVPMGSKYPWHQS